MYALQTIDISVCLDSWRDLFLAAAAKDLRPITTKQQFVVDQSANHSIAIYVCWPYLLAAVFSHYWHHISVARAHPVVYTTLLILLTCYL